MKHHWPSTKGLSVHNTLLVCKRDMTIDEIVAFLRYSFDPRVDCEYVETGVKFLMERGFARLVGKLVVANRAVGQLLRADDDHELIPSRTPSRRSRWPRLTGLDSEPLK